MSSESEATKPLPILPHMPWNIKERIVESVDTFTKSSLRCCSTEYNELVDKTKVSYDSLELIIDLYKVWTSARIRFGIAGRAIEIIFIAKPEGIQIKNSEEKGKRILKNVDFDHVIVDQTVKLFRNPNVFLKKFTLRFVGVQERVFERFQKFFFALNRPVAVERFYMECLSSEPDFSTVLKVLPYFEPGTLKKIIFPLSRFYFLRRHFRADRAFRRISETEQWKKAQVLKLDYKLDLPIEKWAHFSVIDIYISGFFFPLEDAKRTFDMFKNSTHWKYARISHNSTLFGDFVEYVSQFGQRTEMNEKQEVRVTVNGPEGNVKVRIGKEQIIMKRL